MNILQYLSNFQFQVTEEQLGASGSVGSGHRRSESIDYALKEGNGMLRIWSLPEKIAKIQHIFKTTLNVQDHSQQTFQRSINNNIAVLWVGENPQSLIISIFYSIFTVTKPSNSSESKQEDYQQVQHIDYFQRVKYNLYRLSEQQKMGNNDRVILVNSLIQLYYTADIQKYMQRNLKFIKILVKMFNNSIQCPKLANNAVKQSIKTTQQNKIYQLINRNLSHFIAELPFIRYRSYNSKELPPFHHYLVTESQEKTHDIIQISLKSNNNNQTIFTVQEMNCYFLAYMFQQSPSYFGTPSKTNRKSQFKQTTSDQKLIPCVKNIQENYSTPKFVLLRSAVNSSVREEVKEIKGTQVQDFSENISEQIQGPSNQSLSKPPRMAKNKLIQKVSTKNSCNTSASNTLKHSPTVYRSSGNLQLIPQQPNTPNITHRYKANIYTNVHIPSPSSIQNVEINGILDHKYCTIKTNDKEKSKKLNKQKNKINNIKKFERKDVVNSPKGKAKQIRQKRIQIEKTRPRHGPIYQSLNVKKRKLSSNSKISDRFRATLNFEPFIVDKNHKKNDRQKPYDINKLHNLLQKKNKKNHEKFIKDTQNYFNGSLSNRQFIRIDSTPSDYSLNPSRIQENSKKKVIFSHNVENPCAFNHIKKQNIAQMHPKYSLSSFPYQYRPFGYLPSHLYSDNQQLNANELSFNQEKRIIINKPPIIKINHYNSFSDNFRPFSN